MNYLHLPELKCSSRLTNVFVRTVLRRTGHSSPSPLGFRGWRRFSTCPNVCVGPRNFNQSYKRPGTLDKCTWEWWKSYDTKRLIFSAVAVSNIVTSDDELNDRLEPYRVDRTREDALYRASQEENDESHPPVSLIGKIVVFINDTIISRVALCLRFIQLTAMFVPVFLSMPLVVLGPRISTSSGYVKRGALLWYKYFTWTMELAGPSFIKVSI